MATNHLNIDEAAVDIFSKFFKLKSSIVKYLVLSLIKFFSSTLSILKSINFSRNLKSYKSCLNKKYKKTFFQLPKSHLNQTINK